VVELFENGQGLPARPVGFKRRTVTTYLVLIDNLVGLEVRALQTQPGAFKHSTACSFLEDPRRKKTLNWHTDISSPERVSLEVMSILQAAESQLDWMHIRPVH